MVVECIFLSLFSRRRMKSFRGIVAFVFSCFLLALEFFTHFYHFAISLPVEIKIHENTKFLIGSAWWIIPAALLIAETLPWLGVCLISNLKDTSIQSFMGGAVDTLAQLIAFVGMALYCWVTFSLLVIGLGGESLTQYYSIFRMALVIVILWVVVLLFAKNYERNERLYTKVGKDTSYCDVNGTIIRGYDKVSYYGSSFSVIMADGKWILVPSMPGNRKRYALSEAVADMTGHLIKIKE